VSQSVRKNLKRPLTHNFGIANMQSCEALPDFFRVKRSDTNLFKMKALLQEQSILRRRILLEERKRRDTLLKEELLGLCHMACGLFMIRGGLRPDQGGPFTLMYVLRQGSPWKLGVWREGEWRHSPIDLEHDVDETLMAHRFHMERDYKYIKSMLRRHVAHNPPNSSISSSTASPSSMPTTSSVSSASTAPSSPSDSSSNNGNEGGSATFLELINLMPLDLTGENDDTVDQGPWQRLCMDAITFMTDENLTWGGNDPNDELSKLKATLLNGSWHYHE